VFKIAQHKIQKSIEKLIEQQIPNRFLHKITIDKTDTQSLKWEKADREFWHQGKMYDVVRSTNSSQSITYYCIQDTKETQLVHNFQKQQEQNQQEHSILQWDFVKKIPVAEFPIIAFSSESILFIASQTKEKILPIYSNLYQFHFLTTIDFPPELL
jgi:hypothetical protein